MQSSRELQGEKTKPSSVISAEKQRNTIEWENSRSLQENQRYQGNFLCKDVTVEDRNGRDLTEAEDIEKRWQEYTEPYRKDLHDP